MAKTSQIGGFEQIVLLALASFPDRADGMAIYDRVVEATGRDVSVPAVYVTLSRMEEKGLVSAELDTPVRGSRIRKTFRLQPAGITALNKSRTVLQHLWERVRAPGVVQ